MGVAYGLILTSQEVGVVGSALPPAGSSAEYYQAAIGEASTFFQFATTAIFALSAALVPERNLRIVRSLLFRFRSANCRGNFRAEIVGWIFRGVLLQKRIDCRASVPRKLPLYRCATAFCSLAWRYR
jgi:hypothetical protein